MTIETAQTLRKNTFLCFGLLAIVVFGPGCSDRAPRNSRGDLAQQQEEVAQSIDAEYQRLKSLSYVNTKKVEEDYSQWKKMFATCADLGCLQEESLQKKYEIDRWLKLLNPKISLYKSSDFTLRWNAQDRYIPVNEGEDVYDSATGLTWKRCIEGSHWKVNGCVGAPRPFTVDTFDQREPGGWRVPAIFELMTLIDFNSADPSINQRTFPNQNSGHTWSKSPCVGTPSEHGWVVVFSGGETGCLPKNHTNAIRLVREWNTVQLSKLLASPATAVASTDLRPSFSCDGPLNPVERTVCVDSKLARYDKEQALLYTALKGLPMVDVAKLRHNQQQWIAVRNTCDIALCIEKNYLERLAELRRLAHILVGDDARSHFNTLSILMGRKQDRFISNDDVAKDTATGLSWKRCVDGMHWDGATCVGLPVLYSRDEAFAKFTGGGANWRLPSVIELASIVDFGNSEPAMDTAIFPALLHDKMIAALSQKTGADFSNYVNRSQHIISATLSVTPGIYGRTSLPWYVDFNRGYVDSSDFISLVRLVKNTQ